MPRGYHKRLRDKILKLHLQRLPGAEIARQLDCSSANVSLTISRHCERDFRIAALPIDKFLWLEAEAAKSKVYPAEMARALLLDAIHEAMESQFQ